VLVKFAQPWKDCLNEDEQEFCEEESEDGEEEFSSTAEGCDLRESSCSKTSVTRMHWITMDSL